MGAMLRMLVAVLLWTAAGLACAQSYQAWGVNAAGQIWQTEGAGWKNIPGQAVQVSVAGDGSVWALDAGGQVLRRGNGQWQPMDGAPRLVQVSVRNANDAWGLDAEDRIHHWTGEGWIIVEGRLRSISAATNGSVWGVNREGAIFRRQGDGWQRMPGALVQVSVGRDDFVWGVNAASDVWRWNGSAWTQVPGKLKQVAASDAGNVWGLGADGSIVRREGEQWKPVDGALVQVAVANPPVILTNINQNLNISAPPVVVSTPNINVQAPSQPILIEGTTSIQLSPQAPTAPATPSEPQLQIRGTVDIGASPITFNIGPVGASRATCGTSDSGKLCSAVPATFVRNASIVCPAGTFVDVGKWSCWSCPAGYERSAAAVDSDKACQKRDATVRGGFLAATFQGRLCDAGTFFDPIRGGECYSCPEGYKRSAAHIDAPNACYIPAGESLKAASKVKSTIWPHECGSGSFWDGINGGGCWTCPGGYARTAYAVNTDKACSAVVAEKQHVAEKKGKAACEPGEIFDLRIKGTQDISAGGGCWTCPVATDRTVFPVDGTQACERAPGLVFARATQDKALNCEVGEIYDPISSANPAMAAALRARNAEEGDKVTAANIGGSCWTCPPGSKRTASEVYGSAACQPNGITWKPAPYHQPGLFGLQGAEAVALALVAERTTINSVIEGMKTGPGSDKLPADFAKVSWELIGSSPQDSAVLQAAVFSRVVAAANDPARATEAEKTLLADVVRQIGLFRQFMAEDALRAYQAWKGGQTFRQNQFARSQLQTLVDVGEVPPDFEDITLQTIFGSLAANRGINAAIVATMTNDAVFKKLFPYADRVRFVPKPKPPIPTNYSKAAVDTVRATTKIVTEAVEGGAKVAGGMTALAASLGPQIIITIGTEILAVAIEQQIDIANAEPKLLVGIANAKKPVDFKRLMATTIGNDQAQGYWSTLMAGPSKVNGVQPPMAAPRNKEAFAAGAKAALGQ